MEEFNKYMKAAKPHIKSWLEKENKVTEIIKSYENIQRYSNR